MAKHLNPLEKEFLIRQYKSNQKIKLSDFCTANHISDGAFKKWLKQYDKVDWKVLHVPIRRYAKYYPKGLTKPKNLTKEKF